MVSPEPPVSPEPLSLSYVWCPRNPRNPPWLPGEIMARFFKAA